MSSSALVNGTALAAAQAVATYGVDTEDMVLLVGGWAAVGALFYHIFQQRQAEGVHAANTAWGYIGGAYSLYQTVKGTTPTPAQLAGLATMAGGYYLIVKD